MKFLGLLCVGLDRSWGHVPLSLLEHIYGAVGIRVGEGPKGVFSMTSSVSFFIRGAHCQHFQIF